MFPDVKTALLKVQQYLLVLFNDSTRLLKFSNNHLVWIWHSDKTRWCISKSDPLSMKLLWWDGKEDQSSYHLRSVWLRNWVSQKFCYCDWFEENKNDESDPFCEAYPIYFYQYIGGFTRIFRIWSNFSRICYAKWMLYNLYVIMFGFGFYNSWHF